MAGIFGVITTLLLIVAVCGCGFSEIVAIPAGTSTAFLDDRTD
jgi:hypothetical protein